MVLKNRWYRCSNEFKTEGQGLTFVYVDATEGWKNVQDGLMQVQGKFVTATGGTVTTCGNFKIHTFTGPGTFCVSCAGSIVLRKIQLII